MGPAQGIILFCFVQLGRELLASPPATLGREGGLQNLQIDKTAGEAGV